MGNSTKRKVRRNGTIVFGDRFARVFLLAVAALVVGCGPTRKEYAINEALLIDQTRVLEDRLYRVHFQLQRLEQENKQLRSRLEAKGEKVESSVAMVPFDTMSPSPNVVAAQVPRPGMPRPVERMVPRVAAAPLGNPSPPNRAMVPNQTAPVPASSNYLGASR